MAALRTLTTARSSSASSSSQSSPSLSSSSSSSSGAAASPPPLRRRRRLLRRRRSWRSIWWIASASPPTRPSTPRPAPSPASPPRPDPTPSSPSSGAAPPSLLPRSSASSAAAPPSSLPTSPPTSSPSSPSSARSSPAPAPRRRSPGELAALVTACASAFGYSAARLARSLAFLRDLYGGDDCGVVFALRRCPRLLSNDPDRVLSRNLAAVRYLYGSGRDPLPLIKKAPVLLTSSPERIALLFRAAEEVIGVGPESDLFPDAIGAVAPLSPETFSNRVGMLRSYGLENTDIQFLFRHSPITFRLKDHNLKAKLDFFIGAVGLDGRLRPRYNLVRGLQSKGLVPQDVNFTKVFMMAVERFNQEYVHKFVTSEGSNLVRSYMSSPAFGKEMSENGSDSSHSG
uniref:Transcription termination factor MTEF1, chloroplastic n=1 Tax=Ananas comosus var. bracteatus TaxID=296719 RepID=A0A6V7PXN1_ANACO|nr:unnamed protein product [Ananas comosus var. bracteatus]